MGWLCLFICVALASLDLVMNWRKRDDRNNDDYGGTG